MLMMASSLPSSATTPRWRIWYSMNTLRAANNVMVAGTERSG